VAALMAVASVLDAPPPSGRIHTLEASAGRIRTTLNTAKSNHITYSMRSDSPGTVKLISGDTQNAPWVLLSIEYVPDVTADKLPPQNSGFAVEREIIEYGADRNIVNRHQVKEGTTLRFVNETIVEEHVRVVNPSTKNFVAVVVPFASGFEPLNPNLATSSKDAVPAGRLTLKPSYALYGDDAVTFYYDTLPKGTYDFYFRTRSSFTGSYAHPPARAELMYNLKVFGRSAGTRIVIQPKQ
jgi:uncharacterized protein YfaS (alpha-2-macroglobulin family)